MIGTTNVCSEKLEAIISVTYPEGSSCTCTNGTKTLKASDTSGTAMFNVPIGEWTVTCTDGTGSATETVTISSLGQVEAIELTYELVIFDGVNTADAVGGWSGGSVSGGKLSASASSSGTATASFTSKNSIDFTKYTKLVFTGVSYSQYVTNGDTYGSIVKYTPYIGCTGATSSSSGTVTIDITNISSAKITAWCSCYAGAGTLHSAVSCTSIIAYP